MKRVGVLALQGDFAAHGAAIERAGAEPVYVRDVRSSGIDGLIIPGGESTTMLKLLHYRRSVRRAGGVRPSEAGIRDVRGGDPDGEGREQSPAGKPRADGHCGGAECVRAADRQPGGDLEPGAEFGKRTSPGKLEAVFIRAPIIREVREGVKVLAEYEGDPVLIEQGRIWRRRFIRS